MVLYGGTSVEYQAKELRRGVHILVATPGKPSLYIKKKKLHDSNCW